ncbi:hypothetical protein IGI04_004577, partial [Brassica rapa subsp. trilocularis]
MPGARTLHCVIVLGDEKGFTMEATLPFDVALPKGIYLKEADWFEISNFNLIRVIELIRTTRSKYNIKFTFATTYIKIQPIIDSKFLSLANFTAILKGGLKFLTNLKGCSQVLFDPNMAEIQNFKS